VTTPEQPDDRLAQAQRVATWLVKRTLRRRSRIYLQTRTSNVVSFTRDQTSEAIAWVLAVLLDGDAVFSSGRKRGGRLFGQSLKDNAYMDGDLKVRTSAST
jgi:hypothetical protein